MKQWDRAILSYCLKYRKNISSQNLKVVKAKQGKPMLLSKWALCHGKEWSSVKQWESTGLLLGNNSTFKGIPMKCSIL